MRSHQTQLYFFSLIDTKADVAFRVPLRKTLREDAVLIPDRPKHPYLQFVDEGLIRNIGAANTSATGSYTFLVHPRDRCRSMGDAHFVMTKDEALRFLRQKLKSTKRDISHQIPCLSRLSLRIEFYYVLQAMVYPSFVLIIFLDHTPAIIGPTRLVPQTATLEQRTYFKRTCFFYL